MPKPSIRNTPASRASSLLPMGSRFRQPPSAYLWCFVRAAISFARPSPRSVLRLAFVGVEFRRPVPPVHLGPLILWFQPQCGAAPEAALVSIRPSGVVPEQPPPQLGGCRKGHARMHLNPSPLETQSVLRSQAYRTVAHRLRGELVP